MRFWRTLLSAAMTTMCAGAAHAEPDDPWNGFQIIEWQARAADAYAGMAKLGVTATALIADRETPGRNLEARLRPIEAAGLSYYVENIATDFYAPYHRFVPGRAVNALYDETVARWRHDSNDPGVFERTPSLSDTVWRDRIRTRLMATVRAHSAHHPLFYSLGDETGIADLTAAWDFDFSPASLAGFRAWLATRYASVADLNREWGSNFRDWGAVRPETTFEAMRRGDDNFAAWSDFKAWMDASFASAVRAGTAAVHNADPSALAGIEGAQKEGPGGYDYGRLAPAVDVMEIYPDDVNLEIAQDLNPGLRVLTTTFATDAPARLEAWRALLRGSRGLVLWDDAHALIRDDGAIGPTGRALAPMFGDLRGENARALFASQLPSAPVAILYSQASFRARWMLDQRPKGDAWVGRGADGENDDNAWRRAMRHATANLLRIGIRPHWVTPEQLVRGIDPRFRVLLLPHTLALSDRAGAAIDAFARRGGEVLADVAPGAFDEHLRKRATALRSASIRIDPELWSGTNAETMARWEAALAARGVVVPVVVRQQDGRLADDVEIRLHRSGTDEIVSIIRAPGALAASRPLSLEPRAPAGRLTAVMGQTSDANAERIEFILDNDRPALFRLTN